MTQYTGVNDSGNRENFDTGSVRDTREGKGRFDLIPHYPLKRLAQHYENGAKKYGDRNWEKGQPLMRFIDSAERHLNNIKSGDRSEDHESAVLWNIMGYMYTLDKIESGLLPEELDNRPDSMKQIKLKPVEDSAKKSSPEMIKLVVQYDGGEPRRVFRVYAVHKVSFFFHNHYSTTLLYEKLTGTGVGEKVEIDMELQALSGKFAYLVYGLTSLHLVVGDDSLSTERCSAELASTILSERTGQGVTDSMFIIKLNLENL